MPGVHELLVVANRLPVDRVPAPDGSSSGPSWQPSPGGLVAALEPVMSRNGGAWIGWSGAPGHTDPEFDTGGMHLVPVALSETEVEDYYEGMSNATLWPLYHDVIVPPTYHRHWWECYVRVNQRFADASADQAAPGATVWVHDYQLQLVPAMLRALRPDLRIGFFNHIPFPPYELYSQMPWRREVLDGLLGADLLGFQRREDANNLLRACRRMGLATQRGAVRLPASGERGERLVRCAAFPISVDAHMLDDVARRPEVVARAAEIRAELGDPQVVLLGVDRLDYTKGILHRLTAVEELFAEGRLRTPGTVFVQVATPSRGRVATYQSFRSDVEVTVGRINGDHGQLGHAAVHYLHQSLPRTELAALYLASDVLLVTALRDGMNLVAKEYVATRHDEFGALVLSEFTGAASELTQSYLVNPHDIDGLKNAIVRAVQEPRREAVRRMRAMRRQVFTHDVAHWAEDFLRALRATGWGASGSLTSTSAPTSAPDTTSGGLDTALAELASRTSVLVAVDFDGTLAPFVDDPACARPRDGSLDLLARLAALPRTSVAVVSGRTLADLRRVCAPPPGLLWVGGHGSEFDLGEPVGPHDGQVVDDALLGEVIMALDRIAAAHPGTRLETKPTSAVLHTRTAERAIADQATTAALQGPGQVPGVEVLHGKEVVEISVSRATKGTALAHLRERFGISAGGLIYLGDDVTDERAFATLAQGAGDVAVKVGSGPSIAAHRVDGPPEVLDVLARLADLREQALGN